MKKQLLTSIIVVALIASCDRGREDEVTTLRIDVEKSREVNLSEFVEEVQYIRLKREGIPLGEGKLHVGDKRIYYLDFQQQIISIHDLAGRFVTELDRKGKGPGEYELISFWVDDKEELLTVWDEYQLKIIRYDLPDLKFVSETHFDRDYILNFNKIIPLNDGNYLVSTNQALNPLPNGLTNSEFLLLDSTGHLVKNYFHKLYKGEEGRDIIRYSLFKIKAIENASGEIFASVNFDNTLYQFNGREFVPHIQVRFLNGRSVDNGQLLEMSKEAHRQYFALSDFFVGIASFPNFEISDERWTLIKYVFREKLNEKLHNRFFLVDKKNKKDYSINKLKNDLSSFPEYLEIENFDDDSYIVCDPILPDGRFVHVISPEQLIEYGLSKKDSTLGEISQDDNPIIMLMTPKR
jgi:hypothetical protein